jgi:hypothetical protein
MPAAQHRPVPATEPILLGDHRRYPLSRVLVTCSLCGWNKSYNPERLIDRLRQLRAGGHDTPVGLVARRIAWPCPMCGRVKWRADLAWPPGVDPREIKKRAAAVRN